MARKPPGSVVSEDENIAAMAGHRTHDPNHWTTLRSKFIPISIMRREINWIVLFRHWRTNAMWRLIESSCSGFGGAMQNWGDKTMGRVSFSVGRSLRGSTNEIGANQGNEWHVIFY